MAKIGSEHLAAMGRQGLRELRAAMYPNSNVAQQPEYGLYGTTTPGEITAARREDARDLEGDASPASTLESRLQQIASRNEPEPQREPPEMER